MESLNFSPDERVDSPTPLSQPSSDDTPTRLLKQLQEGHGQRFNQFPSQLSTQDSLPDDPLLLSVLNVFVDHSMVPPTPMEPGEFEACKEQANILVPVLRVFGRVIRGGFESPVQTACVYIHGAFPYMLARPVVAGPDGSLHHSQQENGHVDWDDVESVERILPDLEKNLEQLLQSFEGMEERNKKQQQSTPKPPRFIRRITIVVGRGFYTYCPGPPAPFLRVEYYNPKLKWLVKRTLERGLEVPLSYHPDPQQYNATAHPVLAQSPDSAGMDVLKFHCYEAHIPYTMQFFKDYNLSGMSYIQLSDGRFRAPLPKGVRRPMGTKSKDPSPSPDAVFIESNVPSNLLWETDPLAVQGLVGGDEAKAKYNIDSMKLQFSPENDNNEASPANPYASETTNGINGSTGNATVPPQSGNKFTDYHWTRKETSCDLELDTSTEFILNVKSVMTSLPDDPTERQEIHWRAVPSLREIWRQERQRMSTLLKPENDFLSPKKENAPPPFTLNVKKGASVPGANLAVAGMKKLFQTVPGTEEDYRLAMKDIVNKHSKTIDQVDERLRRRAIHGSPIKEGNSSTARNLTPSEDEVMDALDALGSQFEEGNCSSPSVPNVAQQMSPELSPQDNLYQMTQCSESTEPIANRRSGSQEALNLGDTQELSQRVDRGDGIVELLTQDGHPCHVEDLIDPQTLTPYDDPEYLEDEGFLDDEDKMGEDEFVRSLSAMATDSLANDSTEQAQLAYEDDEQSGVEYDTDTGNDGDDAYDTEGEIDTVENSASCQQRSFYMTQFAISSELGNRNARSQDSSADIDLDGIEARVSLGEMLSSCDAAGKRGIFLETIACAPRRGEVAQIMASSGNKARDIHPTSHDVATVPSWLEHSSDYQNLRHHMLVDDKTDTPCAIPSGGYLETVKRPPSRGTVESWLRKKRKREEKQGALKRRKEDSPSANKEGTKKATANLQIDENSRKLTSLPSSGKKNGRKSVSFLEHPVISSCDAQEIEEVEWDTGEDNPSQEQSQQFPLSLSPSEGFLPEKDISPATVTFSTPNTVAENALGNSQSMTPRDGRSQRDSSFSSARLQCSITNSNSQDITFSESPGEEALEGIGQQGGQIYITGGGGLKATTNRIGDSTKRGKRPMGLTDSSSLKRLTSSYDLPSPLTVMSVEIHVQCRTGRAGVNDSKEIAMKPNSEKDMIFAITYVYGRDPGGGEALRILERGCLFVPLETQRADICKDQGRKITTCIPRTTLGVSSELKSEAVRNERHLLLRLASIVRLKDPDMLLSWDTQGAGLGYIIERGALLGKQGRDDTLSNGSKVDEKSLEVDMVRLLGRTPTLKKSTGPAGLRDSNMNSGITGSGATDVAEGKEQSRWDQQWVGSGLGSDWDDRVGPGAAAASIVGRLVFCGWKISAEEVKHPNASYLPAMVSTVLNKRIPHHDDLVLTRWYGADKGRDRWRVLNHRLAQGVACLLMFDALDVIGRAGEAARLSGVEFSQSFPGIRGSQYKVEGVLLRALQSIQSDERGAKRGKLNTKLSYDRNGIGIDPGSSSHSETNSQTQSPWKLRRKLDAKFGRDASEERSVLNDRCYFFYSPSREDTSKQEALECQAMTLEPQSGCYHDPVVVCDFTALYPSLVIAYNLCYSTCAGKLDYHSTRREMGRLGQTTNHLGPFFYPESRTATVLAHHMKSLSESTDDPELNSDKQKPHLKERAYVVPTGSIFLTESVLKGVLPQVLDEMLSTRAMLKKAAKEYKRLVPELAPSILRQLEARQLALKYVANVTYGYTSATFSGRCAMPLLADAIVECGRKTLRNAIDLANHWGREKNGKWFGARAIYGDTDSVFVKLPGRSIKEAFEFGEAFCKAVTASNPPPVQLKLEKVYGASMMQTKKKYCGMKYDSADQKKPTFEAKGIETIRRDQCALTQKVLRNALVTLFRSGVDAVRSYLNRQWSLIRSGRLPVSDFILTGRVRSEYRGGRIGPVQAALARRLAEADPGRTVRHKERLAYVIVATPGANWRLRDCVLTPMELLEQWDAYSIHTAYYITKHVNAALQRCLGLAPFKINVNAWYEACPKPRRRIHFWPATRSGNSQMISSYFGSDICSLCGQKCKAHGRAKAVVCKPCREDGVQASIIAMTRLNNAQLDAKALSRICSKCNGCFESAETYAAVRPKASDKRAAGGSFAHASRQSNNLAAGIVTPIANCSCIDCPNTYERHRLRETELEALELCKSLELL